MNSSLYRRIRRYLPDNLVRWARQKLENSDYLWRKSHYGQFGEDIVFKSILERILWLDGDTTDSATKLRFKPGFYVSVGAFAPKQHSNTYLLYKEGWRGINIDATPGSMGSFDRVLPEDINIEAAISDRDDVLTFYYWSVPNVCNTLSKEQARLMELRIGSPPKEVIVQTRTLASIFDEHLKSGQPIDLFSIDVEQHNLEVLRSNDWEKYSPRFIIVEYEGDIKSIEAILACDITQYLSQWGYSLCGWAVLSLLFERGDHNWM
jgi:FkbM family methyltransferase